MISGRPVTKLLKKEQILPVDHKNLWFYTSFSASRVHLAFGRHQTMTCVRQQFIWHKYARYLTHHRKNSSIHHSHAMSSEAGKSALNKVASAIRTQTMSAWFSAGMAVSEAANIFDKKK